RQIDGSFWIIAKSPPSPRCPAACCVASVAMSEVEFLVGQKVEELRVRGGVRIVFDYGERIEPALYADVGSCSYTEATGQRHEIDGEVGSTYGPLFDLIGKQVSR